jgi:DNA-directed DNA polymerase III PolC
MRIRTGYSFRVAAGMIEDCFARVQELGWPYAPITDRASTFGWVRWNKMCKKAGIKPVFGVELAVTPSAHAKKPVFDHWTFLAVNDIAAINKLLMIATDQFRYEPLLTYEQAMAAKGVIKIAGSRSLLSEFKPADDLYIALSPSASKGYVAEAAAMGHKFIASSDNKFIREDDEGFYEVLCGRGASTQTYAQWILTEGEWRQSVKRIASPEMIEEALANQTDIAALCNAKLKTAQLLSPPHNMTLEEMCRAGAVKLGIDLSDPVYLSRMERELKLIYEKKFEDYFYIIADMMQFARQQMICGPARGSSCGSLVCYLLEITTIDPLKYDLLFERFIDITRNDLPDIDIDFSDQKRHLVFEYMEQKYGKEHIARLGTVALFRPRSAIDEAGAALTVPKWMCDKVLDSLIVRSSGDSRALSTLEDTLTATPAGKELLDKHPEILVAARMEGHPRHFSQHAAGIVVTETPVTDYVAVDARTGATYCDKKDAEDLNLLKIDALGLTQLSIFEDALTLAGKDIHYLETVPLDDKAAFDVINDGKFSGIFQFNGPALQSISNQIKTEHIEDIVSTTALARPGPMASGGTNEWVKRKNGFSAVDYPHPAFEPYLKTTLGIVAYQEQVMEIGRQIGDLTWEDVTALRKAMSKSLGKEYFDQFGDRFKAGAIKKGIPADKLEKIWDDLCAYGAWCFNRSHAVAYGIISYWCAYMKAHFPVEFAAATLTHEPDPAKQIKTLREMAAEGIDYLPVDAELSTDKWSVGWKDGKKFLVGPVQNVKGIGPKMVSAIMSARARGEPLPEKAQKLLNNAVTEIDSLWPIKNAIKRIMPDPTVKNIHSPVTQVIDVQTNGQEYTAMVFAVVQQIKPRDENETVNVAKRGYAVKGPTQSLNLTIADDTDRIFGKIDRFKYEKIGKEIVDRGRPGKALYAFKGKVPPNFRMIRIENVRFIGFMDEA